MEEKKLKKGKEENDGIVVKILEKINRSSVSKEYTEK